MTVRRSWTSFLLRPWSKKRGRRSRTGTLQAILAELAFYLGLILVGVFVLSLVVFANIMRAEQLGLQLPDQANVVLDSGIARGHGGWGKWVVGVVSVAAIGSGVAGLAYRLLHLGFSRERISARHSGPSFVPWKTWFAAKPYSQPDPSESSTDPTLRQDRRTVDGQLVDSELDDGGLEEDNLDSHPPTVPRTQTIDDSPGERLRYRLASVSQGRWNLFGAAALALIWNAVCFVLLAVVISGWWFGSPRPILAILLVPFFGAAIGTLRVFLRLVRQLAGVGSTILEISDHPLLPGGRYELFVSQMGRMRLRRITIELVCEEESFFRQGTDVRADRYVAFTQELLVEKTVTVDPQAPWEQQLTLDVPANAMHSFMASHNAIRWRLIVSGESRPWPSFCRSFPVIVHPPLMAPPDNPR